MTVPHQWATHIAAGTMPRTVRRRWTRAGCWVETVHPQCGPIPRGRILPAGGPTLPGAYCAWELVDIDSTTALLVVAGDYLTAEEVLFSLSPWADEPVTAEDLEDLDWPA